MEEESKINNLTYNISKDEKSYELYTQMKPFDVTEISEYKSKKNLLLSNALSNYKYNNDKNKRREIPKISFIKSLIKKPDDLLFDGYLCKRKKPTINYLLNKTKTKENIKSLEENKLFKNPYPLLKYLSNRKVPNKSRYLITGMLSAEFNDLSVLQKIEMKYKPNKSLIKFSKRSHQEIKSIFDDDKEYNNDRYKTKTEGNFSMYTISKNKFPYLETKEKNNVKDINLNGILNNFSLIKKHSDNKRKIQILNLKKFNSCNNNLKSKEHSTMTDNISSLRNKTKKKVDMKEINHILKDISLLKHKNRLEFLNN